MKIYHSGLLVILLQVFATIQGVAQTTLYNPELIQEIEIFFSQPDWDYQMDTAKYGADGYTFSDSVKINGNIFTNVGVKYKGNSSYDSSKVKNPLHIELDHFTSQAYQGIKDIKLSNGYSDPSMIREVLSYNILGNYMICPRANFAKVFINGNYIGLYSNTESIGKTFLSNNLGNSSGTFIKGNPVVMPGPGTKSNLKYITDDSSAYFNFYEMKSEYGWNDLVSLCDIVTNQSSQISGVMDIDKLIWMLAFNSVLVNLDSYSGAFCQNYYLYRDMNGIYQFLVWDLNMSFGGFPYAGSSNNSLAGLSLPQMQQLTPLLHAADPYWPLINIVMNRPEYRKMYFAHIRTIVSEMFVSGLYADMASSYRDLIDTAVLADANKFYSYEDFQQGMTHNVSSGNYTIPGIENLMGARISYLQAFPEVAAQAPEISGIQVSSQNPELYSDVVFNASINGADEVFLYFRTNPAMSFSQIEMLDDGMHGDRAAGDQVYGCSVAMSSQLLQYFVVAFNSEAAVFEPERAAFKFYFVEAVLQSPEPGDVVVNEFLAKNEAGQTNETGVYADWIELYNNTDQAFDLFGLYLSDNPNKLNKFVFPENTVIEPYGFLIIWADELNSTGQFVHCNFKLSADGESIILSNSSGVIIDSVNFGPQTADVSMGRCPDGTGEFQFMQPPSFGTYNCSVGVEIIQQQELNITISPNPASDVVFLKAVDNAEITKIRILNQKGSIVKCTYIGADGHFSVAGLSKGLYFVEVEHSNNLVKILKLIVL